MTYGDELDRERARLAAVQQALAAAMDEKKLIAAFKDETVKMILADAWDELRMKPNALSVRDMEQLNSELDRFSIQRAYHLDRAEQYEKMVLRPYFARVDFAEDGEREDEIVIGLYSLRDAQGRLIVHDWRAPVCALYYDAMPGRASYDSPSGKISGELTLKRQYRIEDGKLVYFVDTDYSIDDGMLLDVLSGASGARMREIVSTIQAEQNRAIRQESARVLCVTGGAGSGKTSVAMHRAAYLLYHHRDTMDAERICVVSPTNAFSEYISGVLPDLGEENVRAMTLDRLMQKLIGRGVESQIRQNDRLLAPDGALRRMSVAYKSGGEFIGLLDRECEKRIASGPDFRDVFLSGKLFAGRDEMRSMYLKLPHLNPTQRLNRIRSVLESRLQVMEQKLYPAYEKQMISAYRDRELDFAAHMAVAQKLHPVRSALKAMLTFDLTAIYADALSGAPRDLAAAARENAEKGIIWREDGPGIAYLAIRLGVKKPDTATVALLVDEAQDYPDIALKLISLYFPKAGVTLLGDPNQRILCGMPDCDAARWGALFGDPNAPCLRLTRGYRCTRQIAETCMSFLPDIRGTQENVGRDGEAPTSEEYDIERLKTRLGLWRGAGLKRTAVITRTHREARYLSKALKGSFLLSGEVDELEDEGVSVGCVGAMKGLEFDAVAVVWPMDGERTPDESRRLYTACSRALHRLALFSTGRGEWSMEHAE